MTRLSQRSRRLRSFRDVFSFRFSYVHRIPHCTMLQKKKWDRNLQLAYRTHFFEEEHTARTRGEEEESRCEPQRAHLRRSESTGQLEDLCKSLSIPTSGYKNRATRDEEDQRGAGTARATQIRNSRRHTSREKDVRVGSADGVEEGATGSQQLRRLWELLIKPDRRRASEASPTGHSKSKLRGHWRAMRWPVRKEGGEASMCSVDAAVSSSSAAEFSPAGQRSTDRPGTGLPGAGDQAGFSGGHDAPKPEVKFSWVLHECCAGFAGKKEKT